MLYPLILKLVVARAWIFSSSQRRRRLVLLSVTCRIYVNLSLLLMVGPYHLRFILLHTAQDRPLA